MFETKFHFFRFLYSKTGFSASCLHQPILINEHTDDADMEALLSGDERSMKFKRLMYSNPKVQDNLRRLVPLYDRLGIFD